MLKLRQNSFFCFYACASDCLSGHNVCTFVFSMYSRFLSMKTKNVTQRFNTKTLSFKSSDLILKIGLKFDSRWLVDIQLGHMAATGGATVCQFRQPHGQRVAECICWRGLSNVICHNVCHLDQISTYQFIITYLALRSSGPCQDNGQQDFAICSCL